MRNERIKEAMKRQGLKQWEVAELIGISEFTMCRKMRHELPAEEQDQIVRLIEERKGNDEH